MKALRVTAALGAALLSAAMLPAQTTQHKHYQEPPPGASAIGPQGQLAPRLQNLGTYAFPVTTRSAQAQKFFNQGFNLSYGFNHAEAGRAFREVARLDPSNAMAYWGQALVLGPNINVPMNPADEPTAYDLIQKAVKMKAKASPRERDYIDALAQRYNGKTEDRAARDKAYADAMRKLVAKYPNDLDAATLFAESLMDLKPWGYWAPDGSAAIAETPELVKTVEGVLARNKMHPGANHLYIHVMEATASAWKAEAAADRLLKLMPGAGHMVHMPSHLYMRVGRYADASAANETAILADEDYIAQCHAQGVYPIGYYPHNIHFLWWAASMEGRSAVAIEAAKKVAAKVPTDALKDLPFLQGFLVVPELAYVRFGKWDEILALDKPATDTLFASGIWHFARGMAYAAQKKDAESGAELDALRKIVADPELNKVPATFSTNMPDGVLRVAAELLAGEREARAGRLDAAIPLLERAVRYEQALNYTEPSDWHAPVRHSLGAALLAANRPVEAEVVYWDDLRRNPENGWSLFGLSEALKAQGKPEQAAAVAERFKKAWAKADVTLTSSRF